MKLTGIKSELRGSVPMPASKSHTIRAIAAAFLADGESIIRNPLISEDALSAVRIFSALGAQIDMSDKSALKVTGCGGKILDPKKTIDVGNSGTTLRIAAGIASLSDGSFSIELTGDDQIKTRPIEPLLNSLNELGANAKSLNNNGCAPIEITGPLKGGKTTIECITSQYLSSLLFAAPLAKMDTDINVTLLNEPDYVSMTLSWLDRLNIKYSQNNMKKFNISGNQKYTSFDLNVPADFSSATFFLCAGAILDGEITLTGLDFSDTQPDKTVADYLIQMGADIKIDGDTVTVKKSELTGIDIDMNRTPDALPAMAVAATFAKGTTRLLNVFQARKKETDRIACMAAELKKMGASVEELHDGLVIHHSPNIKPVKLNGYHDHRIVMALSLALMATDSHHGEIDTAEAMNITFPNFVELMNSIGGNLKIE
ncbi:MAG: 3-phosphoshikimate 1-carboxyvinyltransferase [Deltaproteobacteria bacterium]|nr:3-phosphoshikimate 1-carboxyvinyltransferase [Deltaproteobacteria bacterium]